MKAVKLAHSEDNCIFMFIDPLGNHSCCEFMCAIAMSFTEAKVSQQLSHTLAVLMFLILSLFWCFQNLWRSWCRCSKMSICLYIVFYITWAEDSENRLNLFLKLNITFSPHPAGLLSSPYWLSFLFFYYMDSVTHYS